MKKRELKRFALILIHSIGFLLLYFVIRKLDFRMTAEYFTMFKFWKIAVGLAILFLVYMIKSYRWLMINRAFGVEGPYSTFLVFFLFTGFLGTITPGRLGEFIKIWLIRDHFRAGITVSTSSVLLDRIWDVLVLSMVGGISMILIVSRFVIDWYTIAIIGLIFLMALGIIIFPGILFRPAIALAGNRPIRKELQQIYQIWGKNRLGLFIPGFSTSLIAFGMLAFIPLMFSTDIDAPINFSTSVTAVSISNILAFIPVSIAGFGTREFVFTRVWSLHSHPAEIAIAISTIYFIITYLGSMLFGGLAYLVSVKKFYRIREIRKQMK